MALRSLLLACATLSSACRPHTAPPTRAPMPLSRPVIDVPDAEADLLAAWAKAGPDAQVLRLDRLLDLLDGARFSGDPSARETLWLALGGHETGRGEGATRDAISRLFTEAMALADGSSSLSSDAQAFVNDSIAMLAADLRPPTTAEDLGLGLRAHRALVEQGHPRIRDNAHLRLYDHVRGTLVGALQVAPARRAEVAISALYAAREDLSRELGDGPPNQRAPWPGPEPLIALLQQHRQAVGPASIWGSLVATMAAADDELIHTLRRTLPAARTAGWTGFRRDAGTGVQDSLAPVLRLDPGWALVDGGRPQQRRVDLSNADVTPLADALEASLIQDGRGTALLSAAPDLPAPELARALRGLRRARTDLVEVAIWEPHQRLPAVLTVLPLHVVHDHEPGAASQAFLSARIHAHLGGTGLTFAIDGQALGGVPTAGEDLRRHVEQLGQAYPRERFIRLTLGDDVAPEQLVDTLIAFVGGPAARFTAMGWSSGPAPGAVGATASVLPARLALLRDHGRAVLDQPFALVEGDQGRLETAAAAMSTCVPELQGARVAKNIGVRITLAEGQVQGVEPVGVGPHRKGEDQAFIACLTQQAGALRLQHHRDKMTITIRFVAAGPPAGPARD